MVLQLIKLNFFIYQALTQSRYRTCRYTPTCSQYALHAVEKHGTIKGLWLASKRIINCHPFSKRPFYDPA